MKEVWFLVITLFVLEPDGHIDERSLYSVRQQDKFTCELEAKAREELFAAYLGKDHIRRFAYAAPYCTIGFCQEDTDDGGTYRIGLNGTLVSFEVGCELRKERDPSKWTTISETGQDKDERRIRSFP